MIGVRLTVASLVFLILSGCYRDDFKLTRGMAEIATRQSELFATNAPKRIVEMEGKDVILAVNGYPLTKEIYEDFMNLRREGLNARKGMNNLVAEQLMDEYCKNYIKSFIAQRLLFDQAFALGMVTEEEMLSAVEAKLKKDARKRGRKVCQTLSRFKGKERCFLYELCVSYVVDKIVHEKIPPKREVGPEFIAAVRKQVKENNAGAAKTNAAFRARLADYRTQILEKKLDFKAVARKMSGVPDDDGLWGEFEEGSMDDPGVQAKVFAMREGEISDVIEDENGYHLVKVLKVTPPEKDEEGRVLMREKRLLSHLYIEKIPMLIEESDVVLTADLKKQMQLQAVNEYVTELSTNSVNRIEYPNGKDLF